MRRRGLQLSPRHRRTLYAASLLLFLSGAAWAWANQVDESGGGNDLARAIKPWLLKIHGFTAVAFVLLLGTLLTGHIRRGWHARKNHVNGLFFLTAISLLTLSGYGLYYIGGEELRGVVGNFHLWLGLAAPLLLLWHIWSGRKATRI